MTLLDIATDALIEIGAAAAGEVISAADSALCLTRGNYILDEWASRKAYAYNVNFSLYTLTPGRSPHLIGPGVNITNTSLTSNVATYTAPNQFSVGDLVSVVRTTRGAGTYNVTNQPIVSATASQFTIAIVHADVATGADSGVAYPAANSAPDFAVTQRPIKVEGATIVLTNLVTPVDTKPLGIRDDDWWLNKRVKSLQSNIPTDLYYSTDWPNGSLFLWPVPNFAYQLRLELWGLITQFLTINDTFSLPPAYRKALMLTLAEELCGPFGKTPSPNLILKARDARKAVQGNNMTSPRISTTEAGQGGQTRGGFNYLTGGY